MTAAPRHAVPTVPHKETVREPIADLLTALQGARVFSEADRVRAMEDAIRLGQRALALAEMEITALQNHYQFLSYLAVPSEFYRARRVLERVTREGLSFHQALLVERNTAGLPADLRELCETVETRQTTVLDVCDGQSGVPDVGAD